MLSCITLHWTASQSQVCIARSFSKKPYVIHDGYVAHMHCIKKNHNIILGLYPHI